jgi:hypothetical protein
MVSKVIVVGMRSKAIVVKSKVTYNTVIQGHCNNEVERRQTDLARAASN